MATRARAWFLHGDRGRGESYECDNGHGWTSSTMWAVGARRRLRPSAVWQSLAFNRTVIPTPQSYAVMAMIGLGVGLVVQVVAGWPWWLGPIALVIGAWLVALSTAFRGAQRRRTLDELHDMLHPAGARERHQQRSVDLLRTATFAVVALADAPHPPRLGGMGQRDHLLTQLIVAYGESQSAADPRLEVETSARDMPFDLRRHLIEEELQRMAVGMSPTGPTTPELFGASVGWAPTSVMVDGVVVEAARAVLGDGWGVLIDLGARSVVVTGYRTPLLEQLVLRSLDRAELEALRPDGLG